MGKLIGALLRPLITFLILPLFILLSVWGTGVFVVWKVDQYRYQAVDAVPNEEVAVVFGAGLKRSGEVGAVLQGRLDDAVSLYKAKKVTKVIVSGDNTTEKYDEVTPMMRYIAAQGVASADIVADQRGISTYDTCYRLKNKFKVTRAILVTNDFHLPRALYTCRTLGVEAVGLATPNYKGFENNNSQREPLAKIKMLIDLYVAPPTVLVD